MMPVLFMAASFSVFDQSATSELRLIVHTDIHPHNVCLGLKGVEDWEYQDFYRRVGQPLRMKWIAPRSLSHPQYSVYPLFFPELDSTHISDQATLIDFDEAFQGPSNTAPLVDDFWCRPASCIAPELLAYGPEAKSQKSDMWALACTIFFLRSGDPLIYAYSLGDVPEEVGSFLGPPPRDMRNKIKARFNRGLYPSWRNRNALREEVMQIGTHDKDEVTQEQYDQIEDRFKELWPFDLHEERIDPEEAEMLHDLLAGRLKYVPEDRMTAQDVLKHPWCCMDQ